MAADAQDLRASQLAAEAASGAQRASAQAGGLIQQFVQNSRAPGGGFAARGPGPSAISGLIGLAGGGLTFGDGGEEPPVGVLPPAGQARMARLGPRLQRRVGRWRLWIWSET